MRQRLIMHGLGMTPVCEILPRDVLVAILEALNELPDLICSRPRGEQEMESGSGSIEQPSVLPAPSPPHEDRWQHSIGVLRLICPGPGLVLPWEMDPRLADVMLDVTIQADDNSPAMHQSFCLGEEPCGGFPMPVLTQYAIRWVWPRDAQLAHRVQASPQRHGPGVHSLLDQG